MLCSELLTTSVTVSWWRLVCCSNSAVLAFLKTQGLHPLIKTLSVTTILDHLSALIERIYHRCVSVGFPVVLIIKYLFLKYTLFPNILNYKVLRQNLCFHFFPPRFATEVDI